MADLLADPDALRRHCARYLGVPFLDKGRDPAGWDCWGLYRHVGREVGVGDFPSYAESYDKAEGEGADKVDAAIAAYLGNWRRVSVPRPGGAAVFRKFGRYFHVGFCLSRNEMLHVLSSATGGTMIERFDTMVWSRLFVGAFIPKEMP